MKTTSRRLLKRVGKVNVHTPGKSKGASCQADWRKKYYFCHPHAYKDKGYGTYVKLAHDLSKS